jgi:hypothetical protein
MNAESFGVWRNAFVLLNNDKITAISDQLTSQRKPRRTRADDNYVCFDCCRHDFKSDKPNPSHKRPLRWLTANPRSGLLRLLQDKKVIPRPSAAASDDQRQRQSDDAVYVREKTPDPIA